MDELKLLLRLRASPWAPWLREARVGLDLGERWELGLDRVLPHRGGPVDAWIEAAEADLDAMLAGRVPAGPVRMKLAASPRPERLRSAHGVLMLAALGWCGPWPDPEADPRHIPILREAMLQVELGPADGTAALFPAGAPVPPLHLRFTDGARPSWATVGLAEGLGVELAATGKGPPLRALRALVLDALERGRVAKELRLGEQRIRTEATPFPMPHRPGWLFRVRVEG